jgi:hypothetical protein
MQQIGNYRIEMKIAEDDDLFLRLAEVGKIANLPDLLLHYRQHLKSYGSTRFAEGFQQSQVALQEAYERRGLQPPEMTKALAEDRDNHSPHLNAPIPVLTHADVHLRWAWWSLDGGNVATARKHAWLATKIQPTSTAAWKVLACAIRGW